MLPGILIGMAPPHGAVIGAELQREVFQHPGSLDIKFR